MLAVSSVAAPLRDVHHGSCQQVGKVEGNDYYADDAAAAEEDQFIPDFSDGNSSLLLESIDFDDLFAVGDVLPDLEILADFSAVDESEIHGGTSTTTTTNTTPPVDDFVIVVDEDGCEQYSSSKKSCKRPREEEEVSGSGGEDSGGSASPSSSVVLNPPAPASKSVRREGEKAGRKSTTAPFTSSTQGISSKGNLGKRKVKVDWTPELHRRFVQAVEQLGVDKAVPSRILELMGIDCLTRHNVASHLQKYRSHRKHVLAREAEAATWTQRRQVYGGGGGGAGGKRDVMMNGHQKQAWHAPMMGFPPPAATPPPPPVPQLHHLVRPLHVWGHPSMDQSLIHMWPKHLPPPTHHHHHPSWTHPPPPPAAVDPLYWHHQRVPAAGAGAGVGLTPGTPCFPQQVLPPTRFPATPVAGILPPPHSMYKAESAGIGGQLQQRPPQPGSGPNHLFDVQPSKESIDAAIGDVLSKPWLPLPLGLKPPAVDSVLVELQRQGIPNVPPAAAASSSSS
ncbi:unnamed protein product [Linum tenue]|uniref:HTH myb-type domain-containing protein n=1 Tax=Linum tenue TaxID=586396 RepID=A0AAV0HJ16_9ROSI|nr:unnamed protein product [Linum tenue]